MIVDICGEARLINFTIVTKEIPRTLTLEKGRWNPLVHHGKDSETFQRQASDSSTVYPMFHLLRGLAGVVRHRSYVDTQAMGLEIAHLAFQRSDKWSACNQVKEITARGFLKLSTMSSRRLNTSTKGLQHVEHDQYSIRQQRRKYEKSKCVPMDDQAAEGVHRAYIALGSNIGDRLGMVEAACLEMKRRGIRVVRTSGLYETEAMYVQDQPPFINGACEVSSEKRPLRVVQS